MEISNPDDGRSMNLKSGTKIFCNYFHVGGSDRRNRRFMRTLKQILLAAAFAAPITILAANSTILGWNNLGMHCMDSDYSIFSILPPYNTIESQLIVGGRLVTNGTVYTVTYEAVADPG